MIWVFFFFLRQTKKRFDFRNKIPLKPMLRPKNFGDSPSRSGIEGNKIDRVGNGFCHLGKE